MSGERGPRTIVTPGGAAPRDLRDRERHALARSAQHGLKERINAIFFLREQLLSCFSRAIAVHMFVVASWHTRWIMLYRDANPVLGSYRCS